MNVDTVSITIPDRDQFIPLLRLVLGGIAMRKNVCFDDLDDVQLAVDDLLANRVPNGGQISMVVRVGGASLDIIVEAKVDEDLCRRLKTPPESAGEDPETAVLDTCRLLRSLMDDYEVQDLPSGRFSIRMTKECR